MFLFALSKTKALFSHSTGRSNPPSRFMHVICLHDNLQYSRARFLNSRLKRLDAVRLFSLHHWSIDYHSFRCSNHHFGDSFLYYNTA